MPFLNKVKVFWPRVETRLFNAFSYLLELLTQAANFEDTKSLSGILSSCWNDEWKQAVETKAKCFKAWRLFLFSSLFLSNMHYWPSVRWLVWLDIWPNSFFFRILLDFLKVLYFFPAWLCHETSSFARSLHDLTHWSSLRSLTFNLWEVDL